MYAQVKKPKENKNRTVANSVAQKKNGEQSFRLAANHAEAKQAMTDNHFSQHKNPILKKVNSTGLPDTLKSGIENLSGYSMNDVIIHYNSSKPTQLQAHANAKGTDIHLVSEHEKHLSHEAWYLVQQIQGRVNPTMQMALQYKSKARQVQLDRISPTEIIQCRPIKVKNATTGKTRVYTSSGAQAGKLISFGHVKKDTILDVGGVDNVEQKKTNVSTDHGTKTTMWRIYNTNENWNKLHEPKGNLINQGADMWISDTQVEVAHQEARLGLKDVFDKIIADNGNDHSYTELEHRAFTDPEGFEMQRLYPGEDDEPALSKELLRQRIKENNMEGSCGYTAAALEESFAKNGKEEVKVQERQGAAIGIDTPGTIDLNKIPAMKRLIENAIPGTSIRVGIGCHEYTLEVLESGYAKILQSYVGLFSLGKSMTTAKVKAYGAPQETKELSRTVKLEDVAIEMEKLITLGEKQVNKKAFHTFTDLDGAGGLLSLPVKSTIKLTAYDRLSYGEARTLVLNNLNDLIKKAYWDDLMGVGVGKHWV